MTALPRILAAAGILALSGVSAALAQDIAGSSDPEVIGARYPGSRIVRYNQIEYDEYRLIVGPVTEYKQPAKEVVELEGAITRVTYEAPKERSTLEVMRNYELALKEKGFETLWQCKNADCSGKDAQSGRNFNHAVVDYWNEFAENYEDQRYLAAKQDGEGGPVYVSLYMVKNTASGGRMAGHVYVQVDVITTKPMDVGLQVVPAELIQKTIEQEGHVAIYGILFDTDSAVIRDDSRAALDEIGKLLKDTQELNLYVVGHTDDQGSLQHNLDLSKRRAEAVVQDLVTIYGIQARRLEAHGLAFLAPRATNATPEGRQKNRRVELVEK
jgi:outer membrane protein OmpA-like peptidoglycan-associated protein